MGQYERVLSTGMLAEMRHAGVGAFQLVVDGTPQSYVDLERPELLLYEYTQRMAHVIDGLPDGPITAIHLGAGALTLPRYIAARRKGSRQQVLELEAALVELVREVAPLPKSASIRMRYGDARETLGKLPAGLRGSADLIVVDIFAGSRTPAHVTSLEFHELVASFLAPDGIALMNIADGKGLVFAKAQLATMARVHGRVAAIASASLLKGRSFGNVVIIAGGAELDPSLPRLLASDPMPSKLVEGQELQRLISGAPIVTDQTAMPSPEPQRSVFDGL